MARDVNQSGLAGRVLALLPVWLMYAALAAGVALGRVLDTESIGYLRWFTFFFAPMSALYCVPFGFLVGMVAQVRVWYTPRYAHRLIGVATLVMLAIMLFGWAPLLFNHPDPTYVLAVAWPTIASGLFMMLGMHMVRRNEYEQSAYDSGVDEYDDLDDWEGELDEERADNAYAPGLDDSFGVEDLGLSTRIVNALEQEGITTADQLASLSDGELLAIKGIGKASVDEIDGVLGR